VLYTRYFRRPAAIPDWPIVLAKVTKAAVIAGVPPEVAPPSFAARRIRRVIPYHCRASYEFPVGGTLFEGSFAVPALD
jgi:hypothetical protein